jgi:alkanesulfonate monooxygenase SsuD/methylene tetrahydromethanopterin reductase-like flavin-dependent oxidoreductase (luciferase family)
MQNDHTASTTEETRPVRERIGLVVSGTDTKEVVATIVAVEAAGVQQIWMTQSTPLPDTLTTFAAAAMQTQHIRMGTAIVPTYPRHPLALAQQVLALHDLAPERIQLGIGPSHRPVIEGVYGLAMPTPMEHLREYVGILRAILWDGKIDHTGRFYTIKTSFPRTPQTPILVSALREGAYYVAGEVSDGAISWVSPVPYLLNRAMPALRAGATRAARAVPPLIAHVPVALSEDRPSVLAAARKQLGRYGRLPFYASMFAEAGFPVSEDGAMSDELLDSLVVSGDEAHVTARLTELLHSGLNELLVMSIAVTNAGEEQTRLAQLVGQI